MPALTGRHRSEAADEPGVLKRRGLLAAAAAFVAGAIAKLSEQPVYAGADGDVVLGTINNAATITAPTSHNRRLRVWRRRTSSGLSCFTMSPVS